MSIVHTPQVNSLAVTNSSERAAFNGLRATPISRTLIPQGRINDAYALMRYASGRLFLQISVSPENYAEIGKHIEGNGSVNSNIDIVGVLREVLPAEVRKFKKSRWALLADLAQGPNSELTAREYRVVRSALRSLSDSRNVPFAGSLTLRITDGLRMLERAPVRPSSFRNTERIYDEALERGPVSIGSLEWEVACVAAKETWKTYLKVFALQALGYSIEEIVARTSVTRPTISAWFNGNVPRAIAELDSFSRDKNLPKLDLGLSRTPSTAIASLLGAYQGSARRGGAAESLLLHMPSKKSAEDVKALLESLEVQVTGPSRAQGYHGKRYDIAMNSRALCRTLADITKENERFPWEYLGTVEEKVAYCRAFLNGRPRVTKDYLVIESANSPTYLVNFGVLLEQLGIPVGVTKERGLAFLHVSSNFGLARIQELALLPSAISAKVDAILAKDPDRRNSVEAYDNAMHIRKTSPHASVTYIGRTIGYHHTTVSTWFAGRAPRDVHYRNGMREWKELLGIPHQDVIPYLTRTFNVPLQVAYEIGKRFTLKQVEGIVRNMAGRGVSITSADLDCFCKHFASGSNLARNGSVR